MATPTDPFAALAALRDSLPEGEERAEVAEPKADKKPKLTIHYERKGRGGKEATIIAGFTDPEQAREAGAELRRRLATGGSARDCEVLLQGDRRDAVRVVLKVLGFRF